MWFWCAGRVPFVSTARGKDGSFWEKIYGQAWVCTCFEHGHEMCFSFPVHGGLAPFVGDRNPYVSVELPGVCRFAGDGNVNTLL